MNLAEIARQRQLSTEEKCIAYLEKMRWPEGVRCPACGESSISSFQSKGRGGKVRHLYQCLDKACRRQFSPTTGTIFHDSHLPLNKWFSAIALLSDAAEPMSANQLRMTLGVQYKTAAHMIRQIRLGLESGTIELAAEAPKARPGKSSSAGRPAQTSGRASAFGASRAMHARPGPPMHSQVAARRAETADLLNQVIAKEGSRPVSGTAVDNMLSMFVSFAQMSVRPPLFFVNYLKDKVFT